MANIGSFPTTPGFRSVNFRQTTITKKTTTASGRTIRGTNGTTLWSGTLRFPAMSIAEFKPIQAFIAKAQGPLNDFDVFMPVVSENSSNNKNSFDTYNPQVSGSHSAGASSVNIKSGYTIAANILKAGDVVRFENHTKVYMVTDDVNVDSNGDGTMNITPALLENLVDNEDVDGTDVEFRVILSNDVQEFNIGTDELMTYEIDVEEVV